MTERVIWSGLDALYDRAIQASERLLIGIGILTGVVTVDQVQLTQEPPQRGEQ